MSDKKIKVTDRRLFTPEGELRDEYRNLEETPAGADDVTQGKQIPPASNSPPDGQNRRSSATEAGPADTVDVPPPSDGGAQPGFLDLIGVVAQPIALYLGDAKMPDGESMQNLDLARLYIGLLEVLQTKTEGNLSNQEKTLLEDLLYQTRLRYVEKTNQGDDLKNDGIGS